MKLGDDKALYLLPFDHRRSCVTDMFHFEPPLDAPQREPVGCIVPLPVKRRLRRC